jgi:hypothetical protein
VENVAREFADLYETLVARSRRTRENGRRDGAARPGRDL